MEKKVLTLRINKKWFYKIANREKKEEYREIKEYWCNCNHTAFVVHVKNLSLNQKP